MDRHQSGRIGRTGVGKTDSTGIDGNLFVENSMGHTRIKKDKGRHRQEAEQSFYEKETEQK
jgi:hypothetical protein